MRNLRYYYYEFAAILTSIFHRITFYALKMALNIYLTTCMLSYLLSFSINFFQVLETLEAFENQSLILICSLSYINEVYVE
jgi:hypothetical protein